MNLTKQEVFESADPIYISADNSEIRVVKPENGKVFDYNELKKILKFTDRDLIQIVYLADGRLMVIDDEGKLKDNAIVNPLATMLWQVNRMTEAEMAKYMAEKEREGFAVISTTDSDLGFPENSIVGNALVTPAHWLEGEDNDDQ